MVRSAPTQGQAQAQQRKRGNSGLIIVLLLVLAAVVALFVVAFLSPIRLGVPQEQLLGLLHGGVANVAEQVQVECVPLEQSGGTPQAITRSSRTVTFRDNTSLIITFHTSPAQTDMICQR